jgi:hypothetical protein
MRVEPEFVCDVDARRLQVVDMHFIGGGGRGRRAHAHLHEGDHELVSFTLRIPLVRRDLDSQLGVNLLV